MYWSVLSQIVSNLVCFFFLVLYYSIWFCMLLRMIFLSFGFPFVFLFILRVFVVKPHLFFIPWVPLSLWFISYDNCIGSHIVLLCETDSEKTIWRQIYRRRLSVFLSWQLFCYAHFASLYQFCSHGYLLTDESHWQAMHCMWIIAPLYHYRCYYPVPPSSFRSIHLQTLFSISHCY